MGSNRFLKIAVICLLLLNVVTLFFLWRQHPPRPGRGGPGAYIIQQLQLDEAQQTRYNELREAHHQAMLDFRRHDADQRQRLYALLAAPMPDSALAQRLTDSLALSHGRMEQITFDHFKDLRALCRPEQQPKFDAIIAEVIQGMMGGEGPPPGREPR